MNTARIEDWVIESLDLTDEQIQAMKLTAAIDLFISRVVAASKRGATDPLQTITTKVAGGNSRATTRQMLDQLGYTPAQRRAIHRLIAGSPSGWPGLLRLYAHGQSLTARQRRYARRQVLIAGRSPHDRVAQPR